MQIMYDACCSPNLYQAQDKNHSFPDMSNNLCPQCKSDYLRKHGYYERDLITVGFAGVIKIKRYYCRKCKRTVSLLPSFCHPKRTYGLLAIYGILKEFYVITGTTVCQAVHNYLIATGIEITRQLLRHYRNRIKKNLNSLIMAVTEIYGLRSPPVTERADARTKVRQFVSRIQNPLEATLKIYKRTRTTYLTQQPV